MVIVLLAHVAVTPAGKPLAAPIPVAPVVEWFIGIKAVFKQMVGVADGEPAVLVELIVIFELFW